MQSTPGNGLFQVGKPVTVRQNNFLSQIRLHQTQIIIFFERHYCFQQRNQKKF